MPPDKRKHLFVGIVLAAAIAALLWLGARSIPLAIAAGGTGACAFVEWYQRARGNGVAEWYDLLAGAAPSWVLALVLCSFDVNLTRLGAALP
jgi:hypothetical protein